MNEQQLAEFTKLITEARDEARAERKKCWRDDWEEKAVYEGRIEAYNYCLAMIKNTLVA